MAWPTMKSLLSVSGARVLMVVASAVLDRSGAAVAVDDDLHRGGGLAEVAVRELGAREDRLQDRIGVRIEIRRGDHRVQRRGGLVVAALHELLRRLLLVDAAELQHAQHRCRLRDAAVGEAARAAADQADRFGAVADLRRPQVRDDHRSRRLRVAAGLASSACRSSRRTRRWRRRARCRRSGCAGCSTCRSRSAPESRSRSCSRASRRSSCAACRATARCAGASRGRTCGRRRPSAAGSAPAGRASRSPRDRGTPPGRRRVPTMMFEPGDVRAAALIERRETGSCRRRAPGWCR